MGSNVDTETVSMDEMEVDQYPGLSSMFFTGMLPGQIRSVYKDRATRPLKVRDFKKAIEDGKIVVDPSVLTLDLVSKLNEIGVPVDAALVERVRNNASQRRASGRVKKKVEAEVQSPPENIEEVKTEAVSADVAVSPIAQATAAAVAVHAVTAAVQAAAKKDDSALKAFFLSRANVPTE